MLNKLFFPSLMLFVFNATPLVSYTPAPENLKARE